MKPHIWKTIPPHLKREAPLYEMIPNKSTVNNNLKSSYNPWKMYVKKFISFLVNFQAWKLIPNNFTIKWTPSQIFFDSILSPTCSPYILTEAPPLHQILTSPPSSQHLWETLQTAHISCWEKWCYKSIQAWYFNLTNK